MLSYLASPYTHPDSRVREMRFNLVCKMAASLMKQGKKVFCPIAHSHPIDPNGTLGIADPHAFWLDQDFEVLQHCGELLIAMLPGWRKSSGMEQETMRAVEWAIPHQYVDPLYHGVTHEEIDALHDLMDGKAPKSIGQRVHEQVNEIAKIAMGLGGAPTRASTLPEGAKERKSYPIASGVLDYFPDAIAAVAHVSWVGNEQHNPGKPLHWDRSKSQDEADTMLRHFLQRGTYDGPVRHTAKMAWRALALLQKEIEAGE